MAFEFRLPDLGEGIREGEIVRWLVAEGDVVAPEQPLVEVMTDKVTAELPSPVAGTVVRLHAAAGDVVPVESVLVSIGVQSNGAGALDVNESPRTPVAEPVGAASAGETVLAVPAIRRLARDLGVDLQAVAGSGPGGRIVERDIRAAAGGGGAERAPAASAVPGRVRRIPLRGLRRVIAEHMLTAHQETAPYTLMDEVDFTELVSLRERVRPLADKCGVRMTYLPLLIAALGMALKEHPELNATTEPDTGELLVHEEQHIGCAVHTEDGLVAPVIRNVEQRRLLDLAREIERLSQAARTGRLSRDDLHGGTFTISSLGARGGLMGTPILNTPQVGVLAVHRIGPRALVRDGHVVPRQTAHLSLTLDHRYIDGYIGAGFLQTLVKYLEDPAVMLFSLAELRAEGQ